LIGGSVLVEVNQRFNKYRATSMRRREKNQTPREGPTILWAPATASELFIHNDSFHAGTASIRMEAMGPFDRRTAYLGVTSNFVTVTTSWWRHSPVTSGAATGAMPRGGDVNSIPA
jgi:hypothetical protein